MYLELFKLQELPFRLSPDPQFLYLSKQHARAKAYMESTIWFTDGFVVITGEIGAGKTTLIETFLRELQSDVVIAQINQTQLSPTAFLQTVLVQFGFSPFNMKKAEVLATLNQFLIEQYSSGRKVLLIIDEAQNLSNRVLEEVRMLSGLETDKDKVLRIILAGQPELNEKLNSQDLIQLTQRIRLRFHLTALSKTETIAYIDHRLEVAGSQGRRIFAEETYATIFRYTGGVPRLVNTLCDTCLMAAFAQNQDYVSPGTLDAAIRELQWIERVSSGAPEVGAAGAVATVVTGAVQTGAVQPGAVHEGAVQTGVAQTGAVQPGAAQKTGAASAGAQLAAEPAAAYAGAARPRDASQGAVAEGHANSSDGAEEVDEAMAPMMEPGPGAAPEVPEESQVVGRLLLACEGKTVMERELQSGRLVIGRTPDNDIQIDSKFISRHHCQILTQPDACVIEDLNSTNGIYVKSKRVRRHNLNDGDVVQVGQHEIMYIDERASRVRTSGDHTETEVIDKAEI
jgi:type II secretory pathway predicted ATPase ExeA